MARAAAAAGARITEVPITFSDRKVGTSKMSTAIAVEAFLRVTAWGLTRPRRRAPFRLQETGHPPTYFVRSW